LLVFTYTLKKTSATTQAAIQGTGSFAAVGNTVKMVCKSLLPMNLTRRI